MFIRFKDNRNLYKSIIFGMLLCLPAGIWFGISRDLFIPGLLAGNILGIALGIVISTGFGKKES